MTAASREVEASNGIGDGDGDLVEPQFLKKHKSSRSPQSAPTSVAVASLFNGLAEEEVVEILRRLPLKLATRCKSVSKKWLNLISSNHFARSYLRSIHSPPQFAMVHRYRGIVGPGLFREIPHGGGLVTLTLAPTLEVDVVPGSNTPSIELQYLAASNGWVLCSYPDPSGEIYFVVNPLTKNQITLPPIPRNSDQLCRVGFTFGADGSFRVVRLNIPDKTALKLDMFSSERGSWMLSTLSFASEASAKRSDVYDCPLNFHAIALNGKLHLLHVWFASEIFVYNPYEEEDPEKYQRLSLPEDCLGMSRYCFGTCSCEGEERKHLKYSEWNKGLINVWELKDYDRAGWCLLHRVHVAEITSQVSGLPPVRWPPTLFDSCSLPDVVAFHPWDRDLVLCHFEERFLQYNLRSKTLEIFLEQGQELKSAMVANFSSCTLGIIYLTRTFFLLELPWWPTPVPAPNSD